MDLKNKIEQLSEEYFEKVTEIRRHIHQNPELSFQEYETAKYIISFLDELNIEYKTGVAKTGVICYLHGKNPDKKVIALRADIDALPIEEKNNIAYKSNNKGVMHACGHDAHTASLLGVLFILNDLKEHFEGTIKFIFQPAEEKLPGGAKQMIDEGVLENPKPEIIIGQHVYPELTAGKLGFKKGAYMASSDEIYLTIKGKGGHGAMPEKITNTVLIASQILVDLQQIPNELAPKRIPTVLTFGKVIANGATNIIPNEVYIEGTFRTFNEDWRKQAHKHIAEIATNIASRMGGKVDVNIKIGYPVLMNDTKTTQKAIEYSGDYLGNENIENLDFRMTSEDFAYYSHKIPAVFYRLGTSNINDIEYNPLHSSNFSIDEKSLKTGMGNLAYIAIQFLLN